VSDTGRRFALRLALALALLFAAGVALHLHGYSISAWRPFLHDPSPPAEILLGSARAIRSDDWNVIVPLSLAQRASQPHFAVENDLIGLGQNALVPFPLPVAHPATLFRPATWGWFLGADAGLAWQWWSQLLGLFGAMALLAYAVAWRAARDRAGVALATAALFVASPFVLFWSLRTASVPAFGALAAAAFLGVASARRPAAIVAFGVLLGWAAACFALELYPAFQVPVLLVVGALALALAWERRETVAWRDHATLRVAALAIGVGMAASALALLFASAGDAIEAMRNTTFPGRRISTGGDRAFFELVGTNLALAWRVEDWGPFHNLCETATCFLFGAPLAAAALARRDRNGGLGAFEWVALAAVVALALHAVVGIPEWLARATGFSLVPGRRSMVALGLADALLAARLLARPGGVGADRNVAIAVGAGWAALLAFAASRAAAVLPELPFGFGVATAAANGALVAWAARARRGALPLAVAAAASLAVSFWFNPLVRGGSDLLRESPIAREVLAIDAGLDGASRWVSFGGPQLPNLFRAIGVHAVNGLHPIPQPALWEQLDPSGASRQKWNRYAHLALVAWRRPTVGVRMLSNDTLIVNVNPRAPALRELGVTHMLVETDDPAAFARLSGHALRASIGGLHVFEARWNLPQNDERIGD